MQDKLKLKYKSEILEIVDTILKNNSVVNATIEDYQLFLKHVQKMYNTEYLVTKVLNEGPDDSDQYYIEFKKVKLVPPVLEFLDGSTVEITPAEAERRNTNYFATIYAYVSLIKKTGTQRTVISTSKNKKVGELPIMVGSSLDPHYKLDQKRGYFIVKGVGKQVLTTEEIAKNTIITKEVTGVMPYIESFVFSQIKGYRYLNKIQVTNSKFVYKFQPLNIKFNPVILLLHAGYSIELLLKTIGGDLNEFNELLLIKYFEIPDRAAELSTIRNYIDSGNNLNEPEVLTKLTKLFLNYAFLHLNQSAGDVLTNKFNYLIQLMKEAFLVKANLKPTSIIDHLKYKRTHTIQKLFIELFDYVLNKQIVNFKQNFIKNIKKKNLNYLSLFKESILTKGFIGPLLSGVWVGNKQNLTIGYEPENYYGYISNFTKIVSPLVKTQQHVAARTIYLASKGRIDACASGHGLIVGLIKTITVGASNSREVDLKKQHIQSLLSVSGDISVFISGVYMGMCKDVSKFYEGFIKLRASKKIPTHVSFSTEDQQINLLVDSGRLLKIVFTSEIRDISFEALAKLSFTELLAKRYIEYLDIQEEAYLKLTSSYDEFFNNNGINSATHLEISELFLHDICSGSIPLLNYNGPARITYGQKLFKQAINQQVDAELLPLSTRTYFSSYNEVPLVRSPLQNFENPDYRITQNPGVNVNLAILPYHGFNLDDALVLKKSVVQRGLFDAKLLKTYATETSENLTNPTLNNFIKPDVTVKEYKGTQTYDTLEEDGLPEIESVITSGQAVIGKVKLLDYADPLKLSSSQQYTDASVILSGSGKFIVKQVLVTTDGNMSKIAKVTVSANRRLVIGDKLSSRYAQKGTVGLIQPDHLLPYSLETGIVPDLIVSPAAYPNRYTFGHILELLLGKAAALSHKKYTEFYNMLQIDSVKKVLEEHNFAPNGTEIFVNPLTGEVMKTPIYTGFSYYIRLEHLSTDKLHIRDSGPLQLLTRQATAGKKSNGGLRFGEMQRDCVIAHGAALVCHERLNIDLTKCLICTNCHVTVDDLHSYKTKCHLCDQSRNLKYVEIPYAFKLLINELYGLGIKLKVYTSA